MYFQLIFSLNLYLYPFLPHIFTSSVKKMIISSVPCAIHMIWAVKMFSALWCLAPQDPFLDFFFKRVPDLIKNKSSQNLYLHPICKNYVYMTKSDIGSLGPFLKCSTLITNDVLITFCDRLVNVRGLQTTFSVRCYQGNNSSKTEIFYNKNMFLSHWPYAVLDKNIFYEQNCDFWPHRTLLKNRQFSNIGRSIYCLACWPNLI